MVRCSPGYWWWIQFHLTLRPTVWVGGIHQAFKGTNNIRDEDNGPKTMAGTVTLEYKLGSQVEILTSYVYYRLATTVILDCDFCDKHVKEIDPRRWLFELEDGKTVPLVGKPGKVLLDAPRCLNSSNTYLQRGRHHQNICYKTDGVKKRAIVCS